jgi:hypothetical protein
LFRREKTWVCLSCMRSTLSTSGQVWPLFSQREGAKVGRMQASRCTSHNSPEGADTKMTWVGWGFRAQCSQYQYVRLTLLVWIWRQYIPFLRNADDDLPDYMTPHPIKT